MKALKIKDKLRIVIFGQLAFVLLLVVFMFTSSSTLNNVSKQSVETAEVVDQIKHFSLDVKDYLSHKISFEAIQNSYKTMDLTTNNHNEKEIIANIWKTIETIEKNERTNDSIEEKVMNLTSFSIEQSNAYINAMSKKLADQSARKNVSILERLVIAGANGNNNNN